MNKMSEYRCNQTGEPTLELDCKNSLKTTDIWRLRYVVSLKEGIANKWIRFIEQKVELPFYGTA